MNRFTRQVRYLGAFCLVSVLGAASFGQGPGASTPAASTRPTDTPERPEVQPAQVVERFLEHLATTSGAGETARATLRQQWESERETLDPDAFLTAALALVSEPFKTSLEALDRHRYEVADEELQGLVEHNDIYLSLYARASLARSYVEQDRLEEAEPLLADLAGREAELRERGFLEPEVDFLLAYCQLSNLHYEAAKDSLETFTRQHPDAPERLRLSARQMLLELQARQPDGLGDVADLMTYASRRLGIGHADKLAQERQQRAIDLLDALIEQTQQAEQQLLQASQGGNPRGTGKQSGQPMAPASESMIPSGDGSIGRLGRSPAANPGDTWGNMREEERQRILQTLGQHFPSQYRQLVEQYYLQLAKEP